MPTKPSIGIMIGTRPEAIKMASVVRALRLSKGLSVIVLSTGQHREMLMQTLASFDVKLDNELHVMRAGQSLSGLTARVIDGMAGQFERWKPSALLVQGDTTSVLGASIAAFYARIPVGHVEAGLRTYNFAAPWPEEMNRRLADPISRWCFAPTDWSAANLRAERIPEERIHVTGNTVVDSLLWVREKLKRGGLSAEDVAKRCLIPQGFAATYLAQANISPIADNPGRQRRRWVLITGHRRESFGEGFENICRAIAELAERYPDLGLLYPVHLNPNVQEPVRRILGNNPRVALIPPVGYEDFIWLMDRCTFVLSDSGGVQEEAPTLGKPVLVMRDTTERPEGIEAGTCRLVGTNPEKILHEASILLNNPAEYAQRSALKNPYGDGHAAERIVKILERDLCGG